MALIWLATVDQSGEHTFQRAPSGPEAAEVFAHCSGEGNPQLAMEAAACLREASSAKGACAATCHDNWQVV